MQEKKNDCLLKKKNKRHIITRITEGKGQQNRPFLIWKSGIRCKSEPQPQREELKNEV